jgi:hypothetical protein
MVKIVERDSYFAGFGVEPDVADIPIETVAKGIAEMSARFGRPVAKNEGRNCRFNFPAFSRPSDVAGQVHRVSVWVEGHSVEDVRAAYRAARKSAADVIEDCGRCNGTGIYRGAGYVENGVFKGYTGVCFRCKGKRQVRHAVNVAGERGRGQHAMREFAGDFR